MPRPARRNLQQRARPAHGLTRRARRCARDLNFPAVFLCANPLVNHRWHDAYYEPVWDALEELDLGPWAFTNPPAPAAQPLEQMLALGSFCAGGVPAPSQTAGRVSRSQLQLAAVASLAIGRRLGTRGRRM